MGDLELCREEEKSRVCVENRVVVTGERWDGSSQTRGTGALEGRGCQEKFATCVGKGRLNPSLPDSFTCNVLNAVNRPVWEKTEAENSMARSRRSQYYNKPPSQTEAQAQAQQFAFPGAI